MTLERHNRHHHENSFNDEFDTEAEERTKKFLPRRSSSRSLSGRIYGHSNCSNSSQTISSFHECDENDDDHRKRSTTASASSFGSSGNSSSSITWNAMAISMVLITLLFVADTFQLRSSVRTKAQDVEWKDTDHSDTNTTNSSGTASLDTRYENSIDPHLQAADGVLSNEEEKPRRSPSSSSALFQYMTRSRPLNDTTRRVMVDRWGAWPESNEEIDHAVSPRRNYDESEKVNNFYMTYHHRDVPMNDWPSSAWQNNNTYLSKFLPAGLALVERAQAAVLAEYGQEPGDASMFDLTFYDSLNVIKDSTLSDGNDRGGWTTASSWKGLKQRLLHAIMTEDSFVFAMGGHSAAAGHGNHFQQSYTLQVQWILEPIFARLGVKHEARNFGNGGLGTAHNGLAAGSIYGPDVDVLMWDSGMTEKEGKAQDLFHRQGLMGGQVNVNGVDHSRIPVLWTASGKIAKFWNEKAGVDVGGKGNGKSGIPKGRSWEQIQNFTYASRYMSCSDELSKLCKEYEYDGVCWIDRPDVKPKKKQSKVPGGRARWHPGHRDHQLKGRVIAFTMLQALKEVLVDWIGSIGYRIPDEEWHLTKYYDDMRSRIENVLDQGKCKDYKKAGIERVCRHALKARTEFTPRAYPLWSNIRTLMPPSQLEYIDAAEPNIYDAPDIFNPSLHPPEGAIDVLSIVEAGPLFEPILQPDYHSFFYKKPTFAVDPQLPVGKGVSLATFAGDDYCDGSLNSFCNRGMDQGCLLRAHNDGRNGLKFDGYSGWIVMNLPDVKNGLILIKFESWHQSKVAYRTDGWTSVNNEEEKVRGRHARLLSSRDVSTRSVQKPRPSLLHGNQSTTAFTVYADRNLKAKPPSYCSDFRFEYAIDGSITSLKKSEFDERRDRGQIQRVVETLTLLDDSNYTGGEEKEVEVAVRIVGCGRTKTFNLNHIYWS